MNRREALGLLAMAPLAGDALGTDGPARRPVAIYDGRFPMASAWAADAAHALDCQHDVALLWYASGLATAPGPQVASGLTTAADAQVVADLARRAGLRFSRAPHALAGSALVHWSLSTMPRS